MLQKPGEVHRNTACDLEEMGHQRVPLSTGPLSRPNVPLTSRTPHSEVAHSFYDHHGDKVNLHLKPFKLASSLSSLFKLFDIANFLSNWVGMPLLAMNTAGQNKCPARETVQDSKWDPWVTDLLRNTGSQGHSSPTEPGSCYLFLQALNFITLVTQPVTH